MALGTKRGVLTDKEANVVALLADGYNNEEISKIIGIARPTIDAHRIRAMRKLQLEDFAALVKYAINNNLASLTSHRSHGDVLES